MGAQDRRAQLELSIKQPGGDWTMLGADIAKGVVAQGFTCSANEGGPDTCSFSLRRLSSVQWSDLAAFNQMEARVGGVLVFGGRAWEAPLSDTGDDVIAVQGRGWQYHLDDDLLQRLYVATDLTAYVDQRSKATASLAVHHAGSQVNVGDGVIVLAQPSGFTVATGDYVTATFDAGSSLIKRVVIAWERIAGASADDSIFSNGNDDEDATTVGDQTSATLAAASGTIAHTFASLRRYHHVFLYRNGAGGTYGADQGVRITSIQLFGATAYESGNASILKASQVIADALTGAPLLDTSTAGIVTTSFSIPDLAPAGYQTPRALMNAANAYEGNLLGVGADRRIFYRERDTAASMEVSAGRGVTFTDASTNSGEGLYNRVIVQGTGPDGAPIAEVRTATSGLLARQGFTRTAVLSVSAPMTTASAQALGDVWLAEKSSPPFKGSMQVDQYGGVRDVSGAHLHPADLMLRVGQRIRFGQVDPATGNWGREGTIKSASYSHDSETATVELDNERGRFETLLERLGVVTTQAVR